MRISDWSSDVCSSDLQRGEFGLELRQRLIVALVALDHDVQIEAMFIDGPVAEAFSAQVSSHGLIDIEHRLRMARSDFKLAVPNEIEIASAVQDAAAVRADRRRTRNIDPGKHIAAARGDRHDKSSLEPCEEVLLRT